MILPALIILPFTILISVLLVRGIEYMQKNHPDYRGEDLFDEEYITKSKTKL
jgi:hypothetical protein